MVNIDNQITRDKLADYILGFFPTFHKKISFQKPDSIATKQQMNLLHKILFYPNRTMSYYCEKTMISRPNMTKLVDSLIKESYVVRKRDEADRRKVILSLTDKGKKLIDDHIGKVKHQMIIRTAKLDEHDLERLIDSFETIKEIFEKLDNIEDELEDK